MMAAQSLMCGSQVRGFCAVFWKNHTVNVVDPVLPLRVLFDLGLCFGLG